VKKFIVSIFTITIFFILPSSTSPKVNYLKGASLKNTNGILVVHLKGSPFIRGFQHGYLLRNQIRQLYNNYFLKELLQSSSHSKLKRWIILQYFKLKSRQLEKYIPSEFREEMRGVAKGSGLSYQKILLMHTFLDVMPLLRKIKKTCTNFVLLPELTQSNKLFHGRNLGFAPRKNLFKNRVIFFVEPDNGFPFVHIGWPGMCGVLTGMNANRISLGETGVGTEDLSKTGIPIMFLLRKIIQYSPDLWKALREISKSKRMRGYTITITDGKTNSAFVAEVSARMYEIIFPKDKYLIAVNHYLTERLFQTMKAVYPKTKLEETSSYKRLVQFKKTARGNKKFDLKSTFNLLRTPPIGKGGGTLQSVLFVPDELRLYFLLSEKEIDFSLEKEFGKKLPPKTTKNPYRFLKENEREIFPILEKEENKKYYRKLTFVYESKLDLKLPNKYIFIYLFLSNKKGKYPCLFFLPHSGGVSKFIEENLGKFLTKNNFAFVTLELGAKKFYHQHKDRLRNISLQKRVKIYTDLIKELTIEGGNTLEWLKRQSFINNDRIALGGLSLGAIIAGTLLGKDATINRGVFLLGGADFEKFILKSRLLKKYRLKLKEKQIQKILEEVNIIDPLNFSFKAKNKTILMINALFDKDMPSECSVSLWRSLEYPRIIWLPEGHFSSYLSFGYVENKILEFLNLTLKEEKKIQRIGELKISAPTGEKAHLKYEHKNFKGIFGGKYSSYEKKLKLGFEKDEILNSIFFGGLSFKGRWESDSRYNLKGKLMYDLYLGTYFTQNSKIYLGFSSYKYSIYDLDPSAPVKIKSYYGKPKVDFLFIKFLRKTTNDKIYPTSGTYFKIQQDISSQIIGSDFDFYRIQLDYRRYYNLKKDRVFVLRTKWGYLDAFGGTNEVPFFEKFYIGGSSTIRGYKGRKVGMLDNNLLPLGGNFFGVINIEFRFPLYKNLLYGAAFLDTGFLIEEANDFSLNKFKSGGGIGLRFRTKWGFVKLDYGFKIGADKDTTRSRLHGGFGLPF